MDILDILLDILLKPPQPFIGLFFYWSITGALFWVKNLKVPFVIGHAPTYTSNLVYM